MSDTLPWTTLILSLALGYGLGSIPFGLVLTRLGGLGDIRNVGSGNIGATNVLRTGNKALAALTLLADLLKGTAAVLIGLRWGPEAGLIAGLGAFLGHLFPVWLGFRGGKGVATYIGIALGWFWPVALAFCLIWLVVAVLFRYSSLSALVASAVTPALMGYFESWQGAAMFAVMTLLVFIRHSANIQRLLASEETKIGAK